METERVRRVREAKRNVRLCAVITFLSGMGFSILYPSLWIYLQSLRGSNTDYGLAIGAYALGGMIGAPIFGFLAGWHYKGALLISFILILVPSLLYSVIAEIWLVIAVRFLQGLGSGNLVVTRTYVVENSYPHKITSKLAGLQSALALGYIGGPAIGALLAFVPDFRLGSAHFHGVAIAGLFTAACQVVVACLTMSWLETGTPIFLLGRVGDEDDDEDMDRQFRTSDLISHRHSNFRLVLLALTYFLQFTVLAAYESAITPMGQIHFDWDGFEVSCFWTSTSLISYLGYLAVRSSSRSTSDVVIGAVGASAQLLGIVGLMPAIAVPEFNAWRFIVAGEILISGLSWSTLALLATYSKECSAGDNGRLLGILVSVSGLARTISPVFFTSVYDRSGVQVILVCLGILSVISLLIPIVLEIIFRARREYM